MTSIAHASKRRSSAQKGKRTASIDADRPGSLQYPSFTSEAVIPQHTAF